MNPQKKAQCVERFIETKSDTQVRRRFRKSYHNTPPSRPCICAWYKQFKETDGLAVLVPSLHRSDHRTSHPVTFSYLICKRLWVCVANTNDLKNRIWSFYCNTWRWDTAVCMVGASISLAHCTYDKLCPCWMCAKFRTNFESNSHRWYTFNMPVSFHKVFIHE